MARPKKDPNAEQTESKLLRLAEISFGRLGYAATRLEDIASEAGIKRSSLLYYFQSKQGLYSRVLKRAFDDVLATLAEALAEPAESYEARLENVVGNLLIYSKDRPGALALVLRELVTPNSEERSFVSDNLGLLLTQIEFFVRSEATHTPAPDYPVKDAILMLLISRLTQAAAGEFADSLWENPTATLLLSRRLLGAES
ncbi:MAG: TetR/AcrR family transcriptional regulator [Myxococcota bacterium]|nr:TetR/AcrR family transcriptional regulator [Myxococcota bacterium]